VRQEKLETFGDENANEQQQQTMDSFERINSMTNDSCIKHLSQIYYETIILL
jgi:hypothetical protein